MVGVAYAQIEREVAQQYAGKFQLVEEQLKQSRQETQRAQQEAQRAQQEAQRAEQRAEQEALNIPRDMLIKSLRLKFDFVKPRMVEQIKTLSSPETLDNLFELVFKCSTMDEFKKYLDAATSE